MNRRELFKKLLLTPLAAFVGIKLAPKVSLPVISSRPMRVPLELRPGGYFAFMHPSQEAFYKDMRTATLYNESHTANVKLFKHTQEQIKIAAKSLAKQLDDEYFKCLTTKNL